MIRVGFALGVSWLGSVNYYRNLLNAICALPDRRIEPVLFVGRRAPDDVLAGLPPLEVVRSSWFDQYSPRWALRKASQQTLARDPLLERFLRSHRIDVFSHSDFLGDRSSIPAICWIGDFQHVHLPHMFRTSELRFRTRDFHQQCDHATRVVLSSHDAQNDLKTFDPPCVAKSRVLQFVAQPVARSGVPALDTLQQRYGFSGRYFHVPNQFWVHKNHRLILDALKILADRGTPVLTIATGATEDYRRPEYFGELMDYVLQIGVADAFRVLGVVPYDDLVGLMTHAVALINPSRAEGWSTTVEEAKSLGKRIILSDLPVHREQAPPDGIYVDPDDPAALAVAMHHVWTTYDPAVENRRMEAARRALPGRIEAFARTYQEIVLDVAGTRRGAIAGNRR